MNQLGIVGRKLEKFNEEISFWENREKNIYNSRLYVVLDQREDQK